MARRTHIGRLQKRPQEASGPGCWGIGDGSGLQHGELYDPHAAWWGLVRMLLRARFSCSYTRDRIAFVEYLVAMRQRCRSTV